MEDGNLTIVRKQFVFLLNYAVDILKKDYIESEDLVLFSKEVRHFNEWLDTIEIPEEVYEDLKRIHFDYSPNRKEVSDSLFLFFKRTPLNWIQQRQRKGNLNGFLEKYDRYLDLFKYDNQ